MASEGAPARYCGRVFTCEELERIRALIASEPRPNRAQLSRMVCDAFGWVRPDGGLKDMSCRVAMLRMHRDGLIELPPPTKRNGNGKVRPRVTAASAPQPAVTVSAGQLGTLQIVTVSTRQQSSFWNELIERYHYLRYQPLPGAQIRYIIYSADSQLLAAIGFGAAAWKVAPRDDFIGWTPDQRTDNLNLIVNNARFLILPWVTSKNLASRILGAAAKQLPNDWQVRYGYTPVLFETFVERQRFQGTCYRAANWIHVGQTQGRGKLDRQHNNAAPVKDIYLYPLQKLFRPVLRGQDQPRP